MCTVQVAAVAMTESVLFASFADRDSHISCWHTKPAAVTYVAGPHLQLAGHAMPVLSLSLSEAALYSGSKDSTVKVWQPATEGP